MTSTNYASNLFHFPIKWAHPERSQWSDTKFVSQPLAFGLKSTYLPRLPLGPKHIIPNQILTLVLTYLDFFSLIQLRRVRSGFDILFRCCTSLSLVPLDFFGMSGVFPLPICQDSIREVFGGSLRHLHIHASALDRYAMIELPFCSELVSLSVNFDHVPTTLRRINFDDDIAHDYLVCEMLTRADETIQELSLHDADVTRRLFNLLSYLPHFQRLFLNRCFSSRKSIIYMLNNVGHCLTHLTLYDVDHVISDRVIKSIAKCCKKLEYLVIAGSNITNGGIDLLLSLPEIIFLDVSQRNQYVSHSKLASSLSIFPRRNHNYELIQVIHSYNINTTNQPEDVVLSAYQQWVNDEHIVDSMTYDDKHQLVKQIIKYYLWNDIPLPRSIYGVKTCFNRLNY